MKTLKNLFLVTVAFFLTLSFLNCTGSKGKPKKVTLPFTADCLGEYTYVGPDTLPNPKCTGTFSAWRAIVDGKGTGTPLGEFTIHFDFCGDTLSNYGNLYAYIITADSDSLFINSSGRVLEGRLAEHPAYVTSYWRDTITILGGTGKYKGATGTLKTDDYNSSEDPNSHHHWKGTITLVKEDQY